MSKSPLCAMTGVLHGIIVGFLFGLQQFDGCCTVALSTSNLAWFILLLAAAALLISLFVLCVLRRYTLGSVLAADLINAVLVSFVVVLVLNFIGPHPSSIILGIVLGAILGYIVGWLLCWLCGRYYDFAATRG